MIRLIQQEREGELQGKRIGLQEGIQTGQIRTLVDLVDDGLLDIKKAAERAGLTLEEFQKRMQEENVDKKLNRNR